MDTVKSLHDEVAPPVSLGNPVSRPSGIPIAHAPSTQRREDRQFTLMSREFGRTGGLATGDDVARCLRKRSDQPISALARWIVDRTILAFEWQSRIAIPLFQFDVAEMTVRPSVAAILGELSDVFDGWELALWFAVPNDWLQGLAPVNALSKNPKAVLDAARADRFVARG